MSVRVRFAPSPTGVLHVGGARTALFNYLLARSRGGRFILRIEDTDAARSTDESVTAILDSMRWLGLEWDEGPDVGGEHGPFFQSQRREHYQKYADQLLAANKAYLCYCSPEELDVRRKAVAEGALAQTPGREDRCKTLNDEGRARLVGEGREPVVRFIMPADGEVAWDDQVRDRVAFQNEVLDDFVLMRSDGLPTYNFACVVDDHLMEITDVVRGDDHISNTPRQIALYHALGWTPPAFAHVPMILGADGSRLSKRHGATSVAAYRDLGIVPSALVNFLALLGWSLDGEREMFSMKDLETLFRIERVGATASIFDNEKLEWMNSQHLKDMPARERTERVVGFLAGRGHDLSRRAPEWIDAFVHAIGPRLKTLVDAETYGAFALREPFEMDAEVWEKAKAKPDMAARLDALAERIESDRDFTLESLEALTRALAKALEIKAGELIGVARIALTGSKVAPGIFDVMWLLGRETVLERLRAGARRWEAENQAGV